jgi:hypothetical protein
MAKLIAPEVKELVVELIRTGMDPRSAARALGVSQSAAYTWAKAQLGPRQAGVELCFRCNGTGTPPHPTAYLHLLGLYLGDGHIVRLRRVFRLNVACADAWPGLMDEAETSMREVRGPGSVWRNPSCNGAATHVESVWKHWPCLFPQHGSGRKHERRIYLADWQTKLVEQQPGPLLRGLFHSDGWRGTNKVVVRGKTYRYPRYLFSNMSEDILGICGWALDLAEVQWARNRFNSLSIARRDAVAKLDLLVGPKY